MIRLDAATVLLQWATGGLVFLWVTTRRREVSLGYGWLLRGTYGLLALGALFLGRRYGEEVIVRDVASAGVVAGDAVRADRLHPSAGGWGRRRAPARRGAQRAGHRHDRHRPPTRAIDDDAPEFPPALDLVAPIIGLIGLIAAGVAAGDPAPCRSRAGRGCRFLGSITDAMLLGHWYLVQPGHAAGSAARAGALGGDRSGRSRWP